MSSEIKYPYIGKANLDGALVVFYSNGYGRCFRSDNWECGLRNNYNEKAFKNITHEYLSNTWGVVESKEHADFIVELCKNAGFKVFMPIGSVNHFIIKDGLSFHNCEKIKSTELKPITIPLPPKSDQKQTVKGLDGDKIEWKASPSELAAAVQDALNEEFELHQKQAVQDCNSKATSVSKVNRDIEREAWPQVGDEVESIYSGSIGIVMAKDETQVCAKWNGKLLLLDNKYIKKPKTAQDIAIEELQSKLCDLNTVDNYILACEIVMGGIKGLVYQGGEMSDTGESK